MLTFGGAFLIYLAFFGGHYVTGDNAQRIASGKALIDCHCNDISPYLPGRRYSKYGIGLSLPHIPLILISRLIKQLSGVSVEGPLNMLVVHVQVQERSGRVAHLSAFAPSGP